MKKPFLDLITRIIDPNCTFDLITCGRTNLSENWALGPRKINDHLLYLLEKGHLDLTAGGRHHLLKPGELMWIQPGVVQHFKTSKDTHTATVYFFRFHLGQKDIIKLEQDLQILPLTGALHDAFIELVNADNLEANLKLPFIRAALCRLLSLLLIQAHDKNSTLANGLSKGQQKAARDYIRDHIHKRFSIKSLAGAVRLHPEYFTRRFTRTFGLSPQEHVKRERIKLATQLLLESPLTITEIAYKLGYEDIYFFSRQFKAVMGKSPKFWRDIRQR